MELIPQANDGHKSRDQAGEALIEIRDSRLYRIEAKTFEEYCQSKFKIERARAYQLMGGAAVVGDLSTKVDKRSEWWGKQRAITETAARELTKVAPERRAEVFAAATVSALGHRPDC